MGFTTQGRKGWGESQMEPTGFTNKDPIQNSDSRKMMKKAANEAEKQNRMLITTTCSIAQLVVAPGDSRGRSSTPEGKGAFQ